MNRDQMFPQEAVARLQAENDLLRNRIGAVEDMMHPGYWSAQDSRREKILAALNSSRKEWRGGNPFENKKDKDREYKLDLFSGVREVYEAWNDSGSHPKYHESMQFRLRGDWPVLGRALDGLKSLANATDSYSAQPTVLAQKSTYGSASGQMLMHGATLSNSGLGESLPTSPSSDAKAAPAKSDTSFQSSTLPEDTPGLNG
jgi:hypothetical protein